MNNTFQATSHVFISDEDFRYMLNLIENEDFTPADAFNLYAEQRAELNSEIVNSIRGSVIAELRNRITETYAIKFDEPTPTLADLICIALERVNRYGETGTICINADDCQVYKFADRRRAHANLPDISTLPKEWGERPVEKATVNFGYGTAAYEVWLK